MKICSILWLTIKHQGFEKVKSSDQGIIFMVKFLIAVASKSTDSIGVITPCPSRQ